MKKLLYTVLGGGILLIANHFFSANTLEADVETPTLPPPLVEPTTIPMSLDMDSTSEQIRRALQESATKWTTLQMEGNITSYLPDGTTQEFQEKVWLDPLHDRYRVEFNGVANSTDQSLKISDGLTIYNINLNTGQIESYSYPDFARVGQYIPPIVAGEAYGNPIWGQIGTPLSELSFSSDYSQNAGLFKPVGMEIIAGRKALIVEWRFSEERLPSWKMWLDSETAVLLKLQDFGKNGGENLEGERVVTNISFEQRFDPAVFTLPTDLPQAVDPTPVGSMPVVMESHERSEVEAGELYFFMLPRRGSQSLQLVKVSGSCVSDSAKCPAVEKIEVPFALNFSVEALSWSPDGKYAAFSYSDNPNAIPTKLWLFNADAKTWTSLVEFPFLDHPIWSPDGSWIAFRTQDGVSGTDIYVIRPDGSELKNISADLPPEGKPYLMDGWYTENILMRSESLGKTGSIYLVRAADGRARPMFETLLTKAQFVASPDAGFLAYDEYDYDSQNHELKVMEPDSANAVTIASFSDGSIYPLIWSPDSRLIAFNHYNDSESGELGSEVYVVSRTGKNLSLVYTGDVGRLIFSPNGKYLLLEESASGLGGNVLFLVDLLTLKQQILHAPGLSTDYEWYAPSWRP
jgi:Tol biopolymer transport system component